MYRNRVSFYTISDTIHVLYVNGIDYGTCIHTHESWIFGVILDGKRIIEVGNEILHISKNRYYVLPPDCSHRVLPGTTQTESVIISIKNDKKQKKLFDKELFEKYSREHKTRKTKKLYGVSPKRLEIQSKIRASIKLLCKGYTESYIATEVDFYDQAHFCHHFKSLWGLTPSELRKSNEYLTFASEGESFVRPTE